MNSVDRKLLEDARDFLAFNRHVFAEKLCERINAALSQPEPQANDWIPYDGSGMPVATVKAVKLRDGRILEGSEHRWSQGAPHYVSYWEDIIAYRVANETADAEGTPETDEIEYQHTAYAHTGDRRPRITMEQHSRNLERSRNALARENERYRKQAQQAFKHQVEIPYVTADEIDEGMSLIEHLRIAVTKQMTRAEKAERELADLKRAAEAVELPPIPDTYEPAFTLIEGAPNMRVSATGHWIGDGEYNALRQYATARIAALTTQLAEEKLLHQQSVGALCVSAQNLVSQLAARDATIEALRRDAERRSNLLSGMNCLSTDEIDYWQRHLTMLQKDGEVVFPPGSNVLCIMAKAVAIDAARRSAS